MCACVCVRVRVTRDPSWINAVHVCLHAGVRVCEMPVSISALLHWARLATGAQLGVSLCDRGQNTHTKAQIQIRKCGSRLQ